MLPRPSRWLIRAALAQLVVGFSLGGWLLMAKGMGTFDRWARLLPGHAEAVLVGWTVQFALGVAWSALPRRDGRRGPTWLAASVLILLNGAVVCVGLGPFLGPGWTLAGRVAEAAAAALFVVNAWPRVRGAPHRGTTAAIVLVAVVASGARPARARGDARLAAGGATALQTSAPAAAGLATGTAQPTAPSFGADANALSVAEEATNYNSQRKVAVAPDGTVAVAYVTGTGADTGVHVALAASRGQAVAATAQAALAGLPTAAASSAFGAGTMDAAAGSALGPLAHLPPLSRRQAFRPTVAYDDAGVLHVAWTEIADTSRQVFYATWAGGPEWTARRQLSDTPGYSGYPALAFDAEGTLHVVWYGFDGTQYQVYYRRRPRGGAWSPTEQATRQVGDANAPSLAVGPDGRLHVVFFTFLEGRNDVWHMSRDAEGWTVPRTVNPKGLDARQPSLTISRDGTLRVAYTAGSGEHPWVAYTTGDGATWSAPRHLSPASTAAEAPSLAATPDDRPLAVFELGGTVARTEETGGGWQAPAPLDAGPGRWPSASWAAYPVAVRAQPPYAVWTSAVGAGYRLGVADLAPIEGGRSPGPAVEVAPTPAGSGNPPPAGSTSPSAVGPARPPPPPYLLVVAALALATVAGMVAVVVTGAHG